MKPEEAIEYLNDPIGKFIDHDKAVNLATIAIEKQIPKKPIERPPGKSFGICPDCMHDVYIRKDINNCANCGQALDWGRK